MDVLAFILALIALVVFILATANAAARVNLVALGLALLTAAWILQETLHGAGRVHFG